MENTEFPSTTSAVRRLAFAFELKNNFPCMSNQNKEILLILTAFVANKIFSKLNNHMFAYGKHVIIYTISATWSDNICHFATLLNFSGFNVQIFY